MGKATAQEQHYRFVIVSFPGWPEIQVFDTDWKLVLKSFQFKISKASQVPVRFRNQNQPPSFAGKTMNREILVTHRPHG